MQQDELKLSAKSGRKMLDYMRPYWKALTFILILAFVGSVLLLVGPKQLEKITDIIIEGINTQIDLAAVGKIGLVLAIIYLFGFLFNYFKRFIMASVTQRINDELRTDISEKINRLPLGYFHGTSYGDVLSRVTNDIATIGQTLHQSVPTLITSVTMLVGSFIMMLTSNVLLAVSVVVVTIIGFSLISVITKRSQRFFVMQQQELGDINGYVEEMYSGHQVVKAYNAADQVLDEFSEINQKMYVSGWKSQFLSGALTPLMMFIGNLSYVVVAILGSALVIRGKITFGTVVAFTIYVRQFNNPVSQITQMVANLQQASAAGDRVFEFLEEDEMETEEEKTAKLDEVVGNVDFENVHFGYTPDKIIINDFSMHADAGEKIAIVGPTGAGKSTLINLLMRFYELDGGDIKIDGVSIQDMKREDVHDLFGMVLQDTWVFEGTVKENIVYSEQGVTMEQVIDACEQVGIDHFVRTLPKGYNTVLDDKTSLSEGQKQQITIARAIVKNAPLLILDEATSSVDTRTELKIQAAMDALMKDRTSFVIAHRLSTIRDADLILVMRDGDIVESGTHDELMALNGFYNELYNSQFNQAA